MKILASTTVNIPVAKRADFVALCKQNGWEIYGWMTSAGYDHYDIHVEGAPAEIEAWMQTLLQYGKKFDAQSQ